MKPHGILGFEDIESARKSAESCLYGINYWIVSKNDSYAWLAPTDYAKKILDQNGLEFHGEFVSAANL